MSSTRTRNVFFVSFVLLAWTSPSPGDEGVPTETQKRDRLIEFCQTVSNLVGANRKQFETMQGTFAWHQEDLTKFERLKVQARVVTTGKIHFALDVVADKSYSVFDAPMPPTCTDPVTGEPVEISLASDRWIAIETPEHSLQMDQAEFGPREEFHPVDGVDDKHLTRIATRDDRRKARPQKLFGKVFDARLLFGDASDWPVDGLFAMYVKELRDPDHDLPSTELLTLEDFEVNGRSLLRFTHRFYVPHLPEEQRPKNIFLIDPEQFYHLVRWENYDQGRIVQEREWTYRQLPDGLLFPETYALTIYDDDGKTVKISRLLQLESLTINEPIPEEKFDISALGLEYGERLQDNISQKMLVMDHDGLVPAEQFTFVDPTEPRTRISLMWWGLAALAAVGLFALGWRQFARK